MYIILSILQIRSSPPSPRRLRSKSGRQLLPRVIKRVKKEKKKGKEEEEKKEVGHERTVIKRIAVISLPVALTFASVDEFNRYHFAWKRARERESERASSLGSRRQWEYLCAASQRVQIAYYSI